MSCCATRFNRVVAEAEENVALDPWPAKRSTSSDDICYQLPVIKLQYSCNRIEGSVGSQYVDDKSRVCSNSVSCQ